MSEPESTGAIAALLPALQAFAKQTQQAVETFTRQNEALAQTTEQIVDEWLQIARDGIERNLRLVAGLLQAKALPDLANIQTRLLRETLEAFTKNSQRISQLALTFSPVSMRRNTGLGHACDALRFGACRRASGPRVR